MIYADENKMKRKKEKKKEKKARIILFEYLLL